MNAFLTGFVSRRARVVLVAAMLLTLAALPFAAREQDHLQAGDTIAASSQSAAVSNVIQRGTFSGAQVAAMAVLLQPRPNARPGDTSVAIERVGKEISRVQGVRITHAAHSAALASARAHPDSTVVVPIDYGGGVGIDQARDLTRALGIHNPRPGSAVSGRVRIDLIGEGPLWAAFISRADHDTSAAEALGVPIVAIVLLLAFGSLLAALLPVAIGAIAIVITGAVIYALSLATDMSIFAATVASMVGLGVAIDYSMFILVRYREELRAGLSSDDARERAMSTSGRAVVYSGVTVAFAQSALFLIPSPGIRSIAGATIIVVAVAVLSAAIVLPALLIKLGCRAWEPGRLHRLIGRLDAPRARRAGFWGRWTDVVMGHPGRCLAVATALLLAAALPTLGLTVRNSASSQLPRDDEVRQGIRLVTQQQGPGVLSPLQVMISAPDGHPLARTTVARIAGAVAQDQAVQRIDATRLSSHGDRALVTATLRQDPESQAARDTIDRLRSTLPAAVRGARIDVGGTTAMILDFDRLVTTQLWRPIMFVLAAEFLILVALLRSPVLALKAALTNLLSVLATYGLLSGVFQHGWLAPLGIHKASTIYPITLPLVLTLASGLSMDYHIFMLSRIRERYLVGGDTRRAVAEALASSASPITSAALIMVIVFLAFVTAGSPSIQQLGFALAVAIALDATIVRLVIVPAAMAVLGDWNWWLPRRREQPTGFRPVVQTRRWGAG
jgi:uncharacterized membrane protein YdfJ with MMPL/SSD domain